MGNQNIAEDLFTAVRALPISECKCFLDPACTEDNAPERREASDSF